MRIFKFNFISDIILAKRIKYIKYVCGIAFYIYRVL